VKAFQNAKTSISRAISAAEQHSRGKALDASFEENNGRPAYRVKTYEDGKIWQGLVDDTSGQVVGQGRVLQEAKLDREDKAEIGALKSAKTSLTDAVTVAEQKGSGKAIDAGLEEHGGKFAYEVETVKDGRTQRAMVDPQSGKLLAATDANGISGSSKAHNESARGMHRQQTATAVGDAATRRLNEQELKEMGQAR
jgi:uncharacterized membrane protein YkoI